MADLYVRVTPAPLIRTPLVGQFFVRVSGAGTPAPAPPNFLTLGTTPAAAYIDVQFDASVAALTLQAALPAYWTFSGGSTAITATSVVLSAADTVRVYHTEPKGGETYTLTLPLSGLKSATSVPYNGAGTLNFTSVSQAPTAVQAQVIDNKTVRVIFSEAVRPAEALVGSNYSIAPPLTVLSVTQETSNRFVLTTAAQTPSTVYTITVSNVKDLAGNPV